MKAQHRRKILEFRALGGRKDRESGWESTKEVCFHHERPGPVARNPNTRKRRGMDECGSGPITAFAGRPGKRPSSATFWASMEGSVRCAYERLVFALNSPLSFQIRRGFCPYKVSATARRISQMHRAQHMRRWGGCVGRLVIRRRTFASKFVVPSARLHCNPPHHQHRSSETLSPSSDLSSTYEQSGKHSRAPFFCLSDADSHDP